MKIPRDAMEDGYLLWRQLGLGTLQRVRPSTHAGHPPAVLLCQPKYPHNVGGAVRNCVAYGIRQCWITGDRVRIDDTTERLPREERMKSYGGVSLIQAPPENGFHVLNCFANANATPVCVEFSQAAESLLEFEHPPDPVYVFGPEDGDVPQGMRRACHRFVRIPTAICLNLATAVATVLYDRMAKGRGLVPRPLYVGPSS
jgi:tRNA(Leu) C34 or U34 (ribose-2'-O)-methylase TrmL